MNRENDEAVTLRTVSNKDQHIKISQEPAMKTLIEVNREMTEEERARTERYLREKDGNKKIQREVVE